MKEKIFEALKKNFEIEYIDENISQKNCTSWDSIRHLNMIIELESQFNISFEPEEIAEMKSYFEIEKVISNKSKENNE